MPTRRVLLRELPPLRAVPDGLSGLGLLVIDGYADLNPGVRPGLGAHAHAKSGIPVTGAAKYRFRAATRAVPAVRGSPVRPLLARSHHDRPPSRPTYADARNAAEE